MRNIPTVLLCLLMVACAGAAAPGAAKPPTAPVKVEFSVPTDVKTGDEVTTVLTFRALEDIERLDVLLNPFRGLIVVSQPRQQVFTGLKRGDGPQMTVTIRLTDPKFGSLAVTYRTQQRENQRSAGAKTIVYGNPGS